MSGPKDISVVVKGHETVLHGLPPAGRFFRPLLGITTDQLAACLAIVFRAVDEEHLTELLRDHDWNTVCHWAEEVRPHE